MLHHQPNPERDQDTSWREFTDWLDKVEERYSPAIRAHVLQALTEDPILTPSEALESVLAQNNVVRIREEDEEIALDDSGISLDSGDSSITPYDSGIGIDEYLELDDDDSQIIVLETDTEDDDSFIGISGDLDLDEDDSQIIALEDVFEDKENLPGFDNDPYIPRYLRVSEPPKPWWTFLKFW